jgi:hypothetical protein
MSLDVADIQSPTWAKLEEHLNKRIEVLHREIEQDGDPDKTNVIRGRIRELRKLLLLGKEKPKFND